MAIRFLSNQTIDSTLDLTGRVKVSGSSTDQYFYEGARTGVGVTLRLYDNANNIYFDSYKGISLRANQIGGSGGNITTFGGNFGISAASPYKKLEVAGDIQLDADNANIWIKSGITGTNGFINWTFNTDDTVYNKIGIDYDTRATTGFHIDTGYPLTLDCTNHIDFKRSGATLGRWDGTGFNVGTVTPQGKLTVVGAIQTVVADLAANDSVGLSIMGMPANNFNAITVGSANSTNNSAVFRFKYNSAGGTNNYLGIGFYCNDDILNVRATGKVGINQIDPGSELHIEGNGGDGLAMLKMNASAGSQTFNWISSVTYPNLVADKTIINLFGQAQSSNNQAYIGFKYAGSGSTSNQLTFGFYANDFLVNLLANGNLGIGTESPSGKLNVFGATGLPATSGTTFTGTMRLQVSGYGTTLDFGAEGPSTGKQWIQATDAGDLSITYPLLLNPNGGDVGIGTTSPSAKLHVSVNSANDDTFHIFNGSVRTHLLGSESTNGVIYLRNSSNSNTVRINTSGNSYFNGGNVGIGTTSPMTTLHVQQSDGSYPDDVNNHLVVESSSHSYIGLGGGTSSDVGIHFGDSDSMNQGRIAYKNSEDSLNFSTFQNVRMTIRSDGNVGIGVTPTASERLSVQSTLSTGVRIDQQKNIGTSSTFEDVLFLRNTTQSNTNVCRIGMSTSGTDGQHHRVSLIAERDTSANYRGEFSIAMRQSDATHPKRLKLDYAGNLTVSGDMIAFGSPSDKFYKENIQPITNALGKVNKLKGVTFDWKESNTLLNVKKDIGFIAQDVQEVLPYLVRENEDGKLSLRDKGIVPILVEAIKELEARIKELENNCDCKK